MIILDTNVLSELMKPASSGSDAVLDWFALLDDADGYIMSITLAETLSGIELMPEGRRKQQKSDAASRVLDHFADRVLPFDAEAARLYGPLLSRRRREGRSIGPFDLLIASIALSCGMGVATRNVDDFERSGVVVINPWVR